MDIDPAAKAQLGSPIPSTSAQEQGSLSTSLCQSCQDMDLSFLDRPELIPRDACDSETTLRKWTSNELASSAQSCRLCEFFYDMVLHRTSENTPPPILRLNVILCLDLRDDPKNKRERRSPSLRMVLSERYQEIDEKGRIMFCRRSGAALPILAARHPFPDSIDFEVIRNWLDYCYAHHMTCQSISTITSLQGLRVIDCLARSVTKLPQRASYVTLSYVWDVLSEDGNTGSLPAIIPRSIQDAMSVTTTLGFRYIWVDRYCIPQDDADEKRRQIQRMDIIYRSSALTIVAAAGVGPHAGLPGVGDTPRNAKLKFANVGTDTIVYLPSSLFASPIETSKWNSRAWTYQEGLLANRRLVFSEAQVYFQCQKVHCWELLDNEPGVLEDHCTTSYIGIQEFFPTLNINTKGAESFIGPYFDREISHPEDTLNAIAGIFSQLIEHNELPIRVLSGLVLDPSRLFYNRQMTMKPRESIALELSLCCAVCWVHTGNITRREQFPSWTWAGWKSVRRDRGLILNKSYSRISDRSRASIDIGRQGEHGIRWTTLGTLGWAASTYQIMAQYLRVLGWVFEAEIVSISGKFSIKIPHRHLGECSHTTFLVREEAERLGHGSKILGLVLYQSFVKHCGSYQEVPTVNFILLRLRRSNVDTTVPDIFHERIGTGTIFTRTPKRHEGKHQYQHQITRITSTSYDSGWESEWDSEWEHVSKFGYGSDENWRQAVKVSLQTIYIR